MNKTHRRRNLTCPTDFSITCGSSKLFTEIMAQLNHRDKLNSYLEIFFVSSGNYREG